MKAKVYRNLHRNCFSVMRDKTRRVESHQQVVFMKNVTFKVSSIGRSRVLREKRKNVHAFVCGEVAKKIVFPNLQPKEAFYNPYMVEKFTDVESAKSVEKASCVLLAPGKIYYWE